MVEQLTGHMVPEADIEAILADPGGVCPGCVRIVIEGLRAEVERLREELDQARAEVERLRAEVKRLREELDQVRRAGEEGAA